MQGYWKAGLAQRVITPEKTQWLAGYGTFRQAEGKRHDLWVKALALEDGNGQRAVVLTSDLVGLSKAMYERLSQEIESRFGLGRAQVMLTYSHNHCAPVTSETLPDYYPFEATHWEAVAEYTAWLEGQIVAVIGEALAKRVPAQLSLGEGEATFAVNRRNNREAEVPDLLSHGIPLQGPVDHRVPVLAVRTLGGELQAVLFGYACHTTTLSDCHWCGDYAGYAQLAVEAQSPGVQAMFWAGCGGDQNPLPRRSVELCRQYGNQLAEAVLHALHAPLHPLGPTLQMAFSFVTLDFERNPTRAEIEADLDSPRPVRARWAQRTLREIDAGLPMVQSHPYPVQVWRLGQDLRWISLGGEAVVDYGLRFRQEFGPHTWTTGYAHDMVAYIPSRRVWEEGGYEGGYLYEYGWPADRWAGDVEERIVATVQRLVDEVTVEGKGGARK